MKQEVKKQYKELNSYLENLANRSFKDEQEKAMAVRSKCGFCGSKNVTQDIKRVQGEIDGETTGSFGIFGGGIYGYVHGEIDTTEVYVCQDCKNVWVPYETNYFSADDIFYDLLYYFYFYIRYLEEQVEFDEDNPKEEFTTKEEKQKKHDAEIKRNYYDKPNILRNFYPETIKWYVRNNPNYEDNFYEDVEFWDDELFAKYGFKMPDNLTKTDVKKRWYEFWK